MDILKLIPQLFFDLISRVVPGSVAIVMLAAVRKQQPALPGVTHFQVTVPMDGSAEIRVAGPGYKPWGIRPRGGGTDKVMRGPVQLVRE